MTSFAHEFRAELCRDCPSAALVMPHFPGSFVCIETKAGTKTMHTIQTSYRGLSLLVDLNWDRLLYAGTIALALFLGAYMGSL